MKQKKKNGQERHWQCGEDVQNMEDKPWKKEELKRMRWLPPKSPPGSDNTNDGKIVEFLEKVEQCGRLPQQACITMFFLMPQNVTSERPIALMQRWFFGGKL